MGSSPRKSQPSILFAVPRDNIWVVCPRCQGPALIREGTVRCAGCAWSAGGGVSGGWCSCCNQWEGDVAAPVRDRVVHVEQRCPRCGQRETFTSHLRKGQHAQPRRCSCGATPLIASTWTDSPDMARDGIDSVFGLPFYMSVPCIGHTLWAANEEHLTYLEQFIGASIRTIESSPAGRSMGYRLPRWMLLAKNRPAVSAGLRRLRAKLGTIDAG